ncbi:unnamed protein product [Auanema sp. JU1783]|nr:unnamed protein product [Auanema sp. JU1783]
MVPSGRNCVPITIPMCSDIAYNMTVYPNLLNHQSQEEAGNAISQFNALVKVKCSEDIKLFLCTVYAPVCTVLEKPIQPCRDLCLSAKNGCESLMLKFGFRWPEQLECDRFPADGICVGENRTSSTSLPRDSSFKSLECPMSMKASLGGHFSLPLASGRLDSCSLPCDADNQYPMLFDSRIRRFLRFWTGGWSVACAVCCVFTIITFLIDMSRFQYPVRPILYMALCYFMIALVYMIGVLGEDKFACGSYGDSKNSLVTQGGEKVPCSALAVLHYYFTMASSAWWVVMCLAWFLAANLKWGAESIDSLSTMFHAVCWGIPALLSVAVLVTNSIDGDVFTGTCSVGNLEPKALLYFVFFPMSFCICLGIILLVCGVWSMIRIRRYIKLQHSDIDRNISKLEKLMLRVSAFAVMYALPTAISAAILCYQAVQMPVWIEGWYTHRCLRADRHVFGFSTPLSTCLPRTDTRPPEILIFFLKYFTQLVVGITCAVWVCSSKTVGSYQRAYSRFCNQRSAVSTTER